MTRRQRLQEIFQTRTPVVIADIPFGRRGGWVSTRQAIDARVHGVMYSGRGEVFPPHIHRWIPEDSPLWFGARFESMSTAETFCKLPMEAGGLWLQGNVPLDVTGGRAVRRMWEGRSGCERQLLFVEVTMGSERLENARAIAEYADVLLLGPHPEFIRTVRNELPNHAIGVSDGAGCDNYPDIVGAGADVLFHYGMHCDDGRGGAITTRLLTTLVDLARTSGD